MFKIPSLRAIQGNSNLLFKGEKGPWPKQKWKISVLMSFLLPLAPGAMWSGIQFLSLKPVTAIGSVCVYCSEGMHHVFADSGVSWSASWGSRF